MLSRFSGRNAAIAGGLGLVVLSIIAAGLFGSVFPGTASTEAEVADAAERQALSPLEEDIQAWDPDFFRRDSLDQAVRLTEFIFERVDASESERVNVTTPDRNDETLLMTNYHRLSLEEKIAIMDKNIPGGGLNCAGTTSVLAHAFIDVLELPVWEVTFGEPETIYTHTILAAEIDGQVYLFDGLFGAYPTLADSKTPAPLADIANAVASRDFAAISFHSYNGPKDLWVDDALSRKDRFPHGVIGTDLSCSMDELEAVEGTRLCRAPSFSIDMFQEPGLFVHDYIEALRTDMPGAPHTLSVMFAKPLNIQNFRTSKNASPQATQAIRLLMGESA